MEERNLGENALEKDLNEVAQEAEALEARLKAAEEELKSFKDRYLRLLADFDNYRKRMEEELKAREREGALKVLRALLPVLDDLDRALEFAQANPESILQGVRAVREGFFRILAGLGVEEVPGKARPLTPGTTRPSASSRGNPARWPGSSSGASAWGTAWCAPPGWPWARKSPRTKRGWSRP
jgi:molecular chaperone GrpE